MYGEEGKKTSRSVNSRTVPRMDGRIAPTLTTSIMRALATKVKQTHLIANKPSPYPGRNLNQTVQARRIPQIHHRHEVRVGQHKYRCEISLRPHFSNFHPLGFTPHPSCHDTTALHKIKTHRTIALSTSPYCTVQCDFLGQNVSTVTG